MAQKILKRRVKVLPGDNAELKRVEVRRVRRQGAQSRSSESEWEWRKMADGAGPARESLEAGAVYEAGTRRECCTSCIYVMKVGLSIAHACP